MTKFKISQIVAVISRSLCIMYIKSLYHIWKLNIYMSTKNAIFNSELFIPIIECNSIYRSSINIFHGSRSSSKILKGISINVNGSLINQSCNIYKSIFSLTFQSLNILITIFPKGYFILTMSILIIIIIISIIIIIIITCNIIFNCSTQPRSTENSRCVL